MNTDTPETNTNIFRYGCSECGPIKEEGVEPEFARKLERERNAYQTALREMIAAKGRFNTQTAMERLIALLPENQTHES